MIGTLHHDGHQCRAPLSSVTSPIRPVIETVARVTSPVLAPVESPVEGTPIGGALRPPPAPIQGPPTASKSTGVLFRRAREGRSNRCESTGDRGACDGGAAPWIGAGFTPLAREYQVQVRAN